MALSSRGVLLGLHLAIGTLCVGYCIYHVNNTVEDLKQAKREQFEQRRRRHWVPEDELPLSQLRSLIRHHNVNIRHTAEEMVESRHRRHKILYQLIDLESGDGPVLDLAARITAAVAVKEQAEQGFALQDVFRGIFSQWPQQPFSLVDEETYLTWYKGSILPDREMWALFHTDIDFMEMLLSDWGLEFLEQMRARFAASGIHLSKDFYAKGGQTKERFEWNQKQAFAHTERSSNQMPQRQFDTVEDTRHGITTRIPRGANGVRRNREAVVFSNAREE